RPSPLHRVRSTTAPAGLYRLLAGWSFWRQHAPWALAWGVLGELPRLPRVTVDGFVVAPASWRGPAPARLARRRVRGRWGERGGGEGGEGAAPLILDGDDGGAAAERPRHGRVYEPWPPPGTEVDRGGRRLEAVVSVVCESAGAAPAPAGAVPPPTRTPRAP